MLPVKWPLGSWAILGFASLATLAAYFELFSAAEVAAAFPMSRIEHFFLFMALAGVAGFAFPRMRLAMMMVALTLFGGALELLEMRNVLNRTFSVMDWVAEIAGMAAALGLIAMLRGRLASRHYRRLMVEPTNPLLIELLFIVLGVLGLLAVVMQPPS
jgi:hypothetical protein